MPTIKVSDEMYVLLEQKRRDLLMRRVMEQVNLKERVKVTFEDVLKEMDEDIERLDSEVNGLTKQLMDLGVRPYWTKEEVKTK